MGEPPPGDSRLQHPTRALQLVGDVGSFGTSVNLAELRSREWGSPAARFTGTEPGFHLPFAHIRIGGVVFRIETWRGRRVYTRLRLSSRFGLMTVTLNTP
jgi:hypothetical protein